METVFVGVSGGVDSAVAALLLQRQGYRVVGVTMRQFGPALPKPGSDAEIDDARRVCEALGIPHLVAEMSDLFCRRVVDEFVAEYRTGRTPNPCITCNREMKFGALLAFAKANGGDAIATGHYVDSRLNPVTGRWELRRVPSPKDQSYMLWQLSQEQLAAARFPLAGLSKESIRALAAEAGLPVAHKGDSMEICFVPGDDHAAFIGHYTGIPATPGTFVDKEGHPLGTHRGLCHYTIGQRKGLGAAFGRPVYVTGLNAEDNTVTLGDNEDLFTHTLTAGRVNFVSIAQPAEPMRVEAKIRYQAAPSPATLQVDGDNVTVIFDTPQRAVTPGQSVVFYQGDLLLGGGIIR